MLLFDDGKKLEKAVGEEAAKAIVFDRDAVEGLIKTWKESDPVRDSRAEETARKERAKVRREEQGA